MSQMAHSRKPCEPLLQGYSMHSFIMGQKSKSQAQEQAGSKESMLFFQDSFGISLATEMVGGRFTTGPFIFLRD